MKHVTDMQGELVSEAELAQLLADVPSERVEWHPRMPGFGRRIRASGAETWIALVRVRGELRKFSMGNARTVTIRQARAKAREYLYRAGIGDDPRREIIRTRAIPLFREFAAIYWKREGRRWKPSTLRTQTIYRDRYLLPAFGDQFLDKIDRARMHAVFTDWSRTRPGAANRCLPILRHMFRTAADWGLLPEGHDPTFGIVPNRPRTRGRHLTEDELERMGMALKALARRYPVQVQIVQLILLTGCRPSEILSLRQDDVRGRILCIADSKTGPRTLDLSPEAQALFASVKRQTGTRWLFPSSRNPRRHRQTLHSFWNNQLLPKAGIGHLRRHDLRHTFASYAAMNGENAPAVMKMLGHASIRATERYMHLSSANALQAAELVSGHLFGLINPEG